jgi:regulator of sirC expression with transglutaminase-like and TPR domain
VPPTPEELDALLRLLDDDTPEVRERVAQRLSLCSGDLSEWLAANPRTLSSAERKILTNLLSQGRREALMNDWEVPSSGANALREDWELFEAMLRVISDFLHDGITFRQPLSDALDLLAEEAEEQGITSANELRAFLFEDGPLNANQDGYDDPSNTDLAWCIAEGMSNPIGLCTIFTLVARRMDLTVEPVNFPGHFLCRIHEDGYPIIIDCFEHGQMHLQSTLLENPDLSRPERQALREIADPGTILVRMLSNLHGALTKANRQEDAQLIHQLKATLK